VRKSRCPHIAEQMTSLDRQRDDHRARLDRLRSVQLRHEALHAAVARGEAVAVDQLLPDRHGVAAVRVRLLDPCAVRLARARLRRAALRHRPRRRPGDRARARRRVGGRLTGRFWQTPSPRRPHRHARRLQVRACGLAPHARRLLDAPQRPSKPPQRQHLLSLLVRQDVADPRGGPARVHRCQRPGRTPFDWPVFSPPSLAGFGWPPKLIASSGACRRTIGTSMARLNRETIAASTTPKIRTGQRRSGRLFRQFGADFPDGKVMGRDPAEALRGVRPDAAPRSSQRVCADRYENDEFGFGVDLIPGAVICRSAPFEHDTGVMMLLGNASPAECGGTLEARRYISANASYNAMLAPDARALLTVLGAEPCARTSFSIGLGGRPTEICRRDNGDGSIDVFLATQAGRWPGAQEPTPHINYTVTLRSLPASVESDLGALRDVAGSMKIRRE